MTDNELQILIKIKEDIDGLRRTQTALAAAKNAAGALGDANDKTGVSTRNLQRANVLLAGAMSGNVVSAVGAVRGAFVSMMGPMGLALAAIAAVGTKLYSMWQESRAAELAREAAQAADEYQWALNRAKERAQDLARESADAFAAALETAREFYEETDKQLQKQFNNMQRIAKARLDLERTKIRNDPALTEQQKILAEQKLLNDFETSNLQLKIKLLSDQQALTEQAKANADKALETVELELEAAKAKTSKNDWGTAEETARLQALKKDLQSQITAAEASISSASMYSGYATLDVARQMNRDAAEARAQLPALRAQLTGAEGDLTRETSGEAAEKRRADAIAIATENQKNATAEAAKYAAQLTIINERLEDAKTTEQETADINRQTLDENTKGKLADANKRAAAEELKTAKQLADEEKKRQQDASRAASIREKSALDQIRHQKELVASNPDLTRAERQAEINRLIREEGKLLAEMLKKREALAKTGTLSDAERAALEAEIAELKRQIERLTGGAPARKGAYESRVETFEDSHKPGQVLMDKEGVAVGLMDASDQLGSAGENIAELFSGSILESVNAISDGIYGWITGTESFADVLRNLGDNLFKELLNTIVKIGAQWLVNTILVKTGLISIAATEDTIRAQQTTKNIAAENAQLPTKMMSATASGISSMGMALVFGALAVALILAAAGAFATGGPVSGGKQLAWLNDGNDGEEFVMRGAARAKYGDTMLAQINAGTYDPSVAAAALASAPIDSPASPAAALAQARGSAPASAGQSSAEALASAMGSAAGQSQPNITVRNFFDKAELENDILTSAAFGDAVLDAMRSNAWRNS